VVSHLLKHFLCIGLVGLAISYALSVTDRLSGMVTSFTETEKQMVSVERAVEYIEDIPSELSGHAKVIANKYNVLIWRLLYGSAVAIV